MVTEQTKKEKMRKTVNCSLMIAGLFFFLNPNYGVLDVLPDFIGRLSFFWDFCILPTLTIGHRAPRKRFSFSPL